MTMEYLQLGYNSTTTTTQSTTRLQLPQLSLPLDFIACPCYLCITCCNLTMYSKVHRNPCNQSQCNPANTWYARGRFYLQFTNQPLGKGITSVAPEIYVTNFISNNTYPISGQVYFEVALVSSTMLKLLPKKSKQTSIRKKL